MIFIGIVILIGIVELVRRRKLNEEYSFLWLVIGFIFLLITVFPQLVFDISQFIGTELPINTLFFSSIILLMLLGLFFSLKISILTNRLRNLTQKIAILEHSLKKILKENEANNN